MISAYLVPLCSTDRTNTSNSMTLDQKQGTSPVKSCNFYLLSTLDLSNLNASYLHIHDIEYQFRTLLYHSMKRGKKNELSPFSNVVPMNILKPISKVLLPESVRI